LEEIFGPKRDEVTDDTKRIYKEGAPPYILPTKHCLSDQIKKNEMGGTWSKYSKEGHTGF
jgi:hypothetical protein